MGVPGRATSWAAILVLVLLTGGAAAGLVASTPTGSEAVAPRPNYSHGSLSTSLTSVPTSTVPPTSTTATTTSPPPPAAVAAVALAKQGQRLSYVATYDISQTADHGIDPTTMTVAPSGGRRLFVRRPKVGELPPPRRSTVPYPLVTAAVCALARRSRAFSVSSGPLRSASIFPDRGSVRRRRTSHQSVRS